MDPFFLIGYASSIGVVLWWIKKGTPAQTRTTHQTNSVYNPPEPEDPRHQQAMDAIMQGRFFDEGGTDEQYRETVRYYAQLPTEQQANRTHLADEIAAIFKKLERTTSYKRKLDWTKPPINSSPFKAKRRTEGVVCWITGKPKSDCTCSECKKRRRKRK